MTRTFTLFAVAGSLFSCLTLSSLSAAVIERDWKTPGDGLLTYDTVSKREWLDVPLSRLSQYAGTPPHATNANDIAFQAVLADLGPGGKFEGFIVARRDDVVAIAQSAGIDTNTDDYLVNVSATTNLIELLGVTWAVSFEYRTTLGLVDEVCGEVFPSCGPFASSLVAGVFVAIDDPSPINDQAGLLFAYDNDTVGPSRSGVLMYRFAVPEPEAALLVATALCVLFSYQGGNGTAPYRLKTLNRNRR